MKLEMLVQPFGNTVGDRLVAELASGRWQEFRASVAFAKMSGVSYMDMPLRGFVEDGGTVSLSVGADNGGTSFEAVSQLLGAVGPGSLFVTKHIGAPAPTFHPKVFLFLSRDGKGEVADALVISGSANFTRGGLFSNYEFSTAWEPDLGDAAEKSALGVVVKTLDDWGSVTKGLAIPIDSATLLDLLERGLLPREATIAQATAAARAIRSPTTEIPAKPPAPLREQPRPPLPKQGNAPGAPAISLPPVPASSPARARFFHRQAERLRHWSRTLWGRK